VDGELNMNTGQQLNGKLSTLSIDYREITEMLLWKAGVSLTLIGTEKDQGTNGAQ